MARKISIFIYGMIAYLVFLATFCYAIGWVGNILVPKSIDSAAEGPIGQSILIDLLLLGIFALQHSVMARPTFKRWWTKIIPREAERSTFTLLASLALILLFWQWQPIGVTIWDIQNPTARLVLQGLFFGGWLLVLTATFLINHFDLFGLRHVWLHLQGKEYAKLRFGTPWLYKHVRHPLYLGFLTAFWATPTMTIAHLVFAVTTTAYILFAIQLEERNLIDIHGREYVEYRKHVPMLLPGLRKKKPASPERAPAESPAA
jgi:protein-S-isoprenylcysteine O-methyltransferase Ste14